MDEQQLNNYLSYALGHVTTWLDIYATTLGLPPSAFTRRVAELLQNASGPLPWAEYHLPSLRGETAEGSQVRQSKVALAERSFSGASVETPPKRRVGGRRPRLKCPHCGANPPTGMRGGTRRQRWMRQHINEEHVATKSARKAGIDTKTMPKVNGSGKYYDPRAGKRGGAHPPIRNVALQVLKQAGEPITMSEWRERVEKKIHRRVPPSSIFSIQRVVPNVRRFGGELNEQGRKTLVFVEYVEPQAEGVA